MRKHFRLSFETKKGSFSLQLTIVKSFGERVHLKQGYNGQPVRWIKVTLKDPDVKKITSRKEIDHIVQCDELQHIYPSGEEDDEGNPKYVVIDKESLKDSFPSSDEMTVCQTVKLSSIPFNYLDDAHYFLNVKVEKKKDKKAKKDSDDVKLYSLVYLGLKENNEALLVRYNSMNTIKHGIVYAGKDGLMLSNIIPTNYQKKREDEQKIKEIASLKAYDVLVSATRDKDKKKWKFEDEYGLLLEKLIKATLNGEKIEKKKVKPKSFSKLDSLFDEDEDEEDEDEDEEDEDLALNRAKENKKRRPESSSKDKKKKKMKQEDAD